MKKQAAGGDDKFDGANAATEQDIREQQGQGGGGGGGAKTNEESYPVGLEALNGYFDNLAAAAMTEKAVLEELVKANATLTGTNKELSGVVKKITAENWQLQQEVNNLRKKVGAAPSPAIAPNRTGPSVLCPKRKQTVFHRPDDCFELEKNPSRRPVGWRSRL